MTEPQMEGKRVSRRTTIGVTERLAGKRDQMQELAEASELPTEAVMAAYQAKLEAVEAGKDHLTETLAVVESVLATQRVPEDPKPPPVMEQAPDLGAEVKVMRSLERMLKRSGGMTSAKYEVLTELYEELRSWPTED